MRLKQFVKKLIGFEEVSVTGVNLEGANIVVDVRPRRRAPRCGECGCRAVGYDTEGPRRWTHLAYGVLRIVLVYACRRVECAKCGVRVEQVPWAAHRSRFTRPFEELAAYHAQVTNRTAASRLLGISWSTIGTIIERVIRDRLDPNRFDGLRHIGVDEFSYRKRHRYLTIVVDHLRRRVVWAAPGSGAKTLGLFFDEIGPVRASEIELATADMAAGYTKAIEERAKNAEIVYDRFHVQRLASDAVDEVRRALVRDSKGTPEADAIKNVRFILLKNPCDLTHRERRKLSDVERYYRPLYRAYLLKEALAGALDNPNPDRARVEIENWLLWASRSKLAPFIRVARTIRKFKDRILAYVSTRRTNALAEGINNRLRSIARRAFGFHSSQPIIAMLYLCCGGIQLNPPLPQSPT